MKNILIAGIIGATVNATGATGATGAYNYVQKVEAAQPQADHTHIIEQTQTVWKGLKTEGSDASKGSWAVKADEGEKKIGSGVQGAADGKVWQTIKI